MFCIVLRIYLKSEVFEELSIVGNPTKENLLVVHLLTSIPLSYDFLITALADNEDVPTLELVAERLLHENLNLKEK